MPQPDTRVSTWRTSEAHRLLLAEFIWPRDPASYTTKEWWRGALGESPDVAIARFQGEGLLVEPGLEDKVSNAFTAANLKVQLKARGLKVSGHKEELAKRLAQADPEGMRRVVSDEPLLICSKVGMELAEQIKAERITEKEQTERQAFEDLLAHRFIDATRCVVAYESKQVFQRGLNVDWKKIDPADYARTIQAIFSGRPKILSRLSDGQINILAIGAAMMELCGTNRCDKWLPLDFHIDLQLDNSTAARMLLFFAQHQAAIEGYKKSGVVGYAEVLGSGDSCDACKKVLGKYSLDDVPELPHPDCTHPMGCRCCPAPGTVER